MITYIQSVKFLLRLLLVIVVPFNISAVAFRVIVALFARLTSIVVLFVVLRIEKAVLIDANNLLLQEVRGALLVDRGDVVLANEKVLAVGFGLAEAHHRLICVQPALPAQATAAVENFSLARRLRRQGLLAPRIEQELVVLELAHDLYLFELFVPVVVQDLSVLGVAIVHDHLDLIVAQGVILSRLQDIVNLLTVEREVAELHVTVERLRLERHARSLRVLLILRVASAVDYSLRPDLFIEVLLLEFRVVLGLPLVDFNFSLEDDPIL